LTFSVTANFTQNTDDGCHTRIGNTWGGADVDASWGGYNNYPYCQTSNMNMSTHITRTMTTNISISKSALMSGNDLKLKFAARMPNGSNQTEGVGLKDVTISFVSWS